MKLAACCLKQLVGASLPLQKKARRSGIPVRCGGLQDRAASPPALRRGTGLVKGQGQSARVIHPTYLLTVLFAVLDLGVQISAVSSLVPLLYQLTWPTTGAAVDVVVAGRGGVGPHQAGLPALGPRREIR